MIDINNFIEAKFREVNQWSNNSSEYENLYTEFQDKRLITIFSILHTNIINQFCFLNRRLPTGDSGAHFWADNSRILLTSLNMVFTLRENLRSSKYEFEIEQDYLQIMLTCKNFLVVSGGSLIPPYMELITIYYTIPIFIPNTKIILDTNHIESYASLTFIGQGSYANVYKYKDSFYNKSFVIKKAKANLTTKELERFKNEFNVLKDLNSPYIIEVFRYFENEHKYTMELMDITLQRYIMANNQKLAKDERHKIISQTLNAFRYIHSKGLLHRDISSNNILIKIYDDTLVVKLSDFGLVKIPSSQLTSVDTEFKGSFNDPSLLHEGFNNYTIYHETYALTRLVYFILTGKTNCSFSAKNEFSDFISKGLDPNKYNRYKSIDELYKQYLKIK